MVDWELLSFIKRSKQRIHILTTFQSGITPNEIVKKTSLSPSHISRTLKDFVKRGLIYCETPDNHVGRIYVITPKGEEIQELIKSGKLAEKYSS